jgi:hypothetical protein
MSQGGIRDPTTRGYLVATAFVCREKTKPMSDDVVRHAKRDYTCHDCSCAIRAGELYFNLYKDFTVLCMECYDKRKERWTALRDMSGRRKQLLADLGDQPWAASDLQRKYGSAYIKWMGIRSDVIGLDLRSITSSTKSDGDR